MPATKHVTNQPLFSGFRPRPPCPLRCIAWVTLCCLLAAPGSDHAVAQNSPPAAVTEPQSSSDSPLDAIAPLLREHCLDCHSAEAAEGNVVLDASQSVKDIGLWHRVLKNVRAEIMPPHTHSRLSDAQKRELVGWITERVFRIDARRPPAGYVAPRRLNRTEYRNTIRDLMGVDFNAEVVFPPDDTGFGFDNVGESLSLSTLMLEKYLLAAQAIVAEAVPTETWTLPQQVWRGAEIRNEQGVNLDFLRISQPLKFSLDFSIEHPGEYSLKIDQRLHGSFDYIPLTYQVRAQLSSIGQAGTDSGERSNTLELFQAEYKWEEGKQVAYQLRQHFPAGNYRIDWSISEIDDGNNSDTPQENQDTFVAYQIDKVILQGPPDPALRVHPPRYELFFDQDQPPEEPHARAEYMRQTLERFAKRAFRRAAPEATLNRLTQIAEETYSVKGNTFEQGIAKAITAILVSPRFLLKHDSTIEGDDLIDEFSLASRLSYFLWSTLPDRTLTDLAEQGKLRDNLDQQLERMLRDKRAQSFTRNFVGQWLRTRDVESTPIDAIAALGFQPEFESLRSQFLGRVRRGRNERGTPEEEQARARLQELRQLRDLIDASVRTAMRQETEMQFDYLVAENRSLLELIQADYTFVNEKLAKLYAIDGVEGDRMRRVDLAPQHHRGGILTQGSMLVVTSNPTRTSPVKRGLYVLDNILGTPAPPAPPNVPALEDAGNRFGDRTPSLRELLAVHREAALCSSCHNRMDPLGLALENYNAFGKYRQTDAGNPIQADGELITGERFSNLDELKQILVSSRKRDFYRCVAEKMLVYALGRGLDYRDETTIDQIVEHLDARGGRARDLIQLVVNSPPFQRQRIAHSAAQIQ
jgi:Protein of unknown function (DUF1592)/Protein of unknown function (DUF1588)/Protein of unknown function (DUF1585)/Protein of unknown function (DUF1587)/Protein of unknown function (DUF1595)/Planctomycete cytochrome C